MPKKHLHNRVNKNELRSQMKYAHVARTTLSFYQYLDIKDTQAYRDKLYDQLDDIGVLGRIYVANEGINAQISLPTENLDVLREVLSKNQLDPNLRLNIAVEDDGKSFFKLTIKVRPQIVADGLTADEFSFEKKGTHITAARFNELANDEQNTVIVDMRNHYESEVGHFKNAIKPDVETFKESLPIVSDLLEEHRDKNILMYCTGGIRCEKASAYFRKQGYEQVFQLDGGIIEYTRQVKSEKLENKFVGKNFVFDERMGERITEDVIAKCHQCGAPSDHHVNCANHRCHILFIQCDACAKKYNHCCSKRCADYISMSEEEKQYLSEEPVFNGTAAGKARYNPQNKDLGFDIKKREA